MPQTGNAWLVAYNPDEMTGKMWVAMGTIEDFSDVTPADWTSWVTQLADFHETDGERDVTEESCAAEPMEPVVEATGCTQASIAAAWTPLFLLIPLTYRRRRDDFKLEHNA